MNRVKLWVFTLLVVAAGFLALRAATVARRADALAALDARLASAAAHVQSSLGAAGREAAAAAAHVARDERLAAALRPPATPAPAPIPAVQKGRRAAKPPPPPAAPVDPAAAEAALQGASRAALSGAEKAFGFDFPASTVVLAATRESLAAKGDPAKGEGEVAALLRAAADGQSRRGVVRLNGALWQAAAAPAGDGSGVVVVVPLDADWARANATATGADVTISVPDVNILSTARPADVPSLQAATKRAGAGDVGRPGAVDVSVGPVKLPKLPQPVPGGAPLRARAVPVEGLENAFVVVSLAAAGPLDAAAAFHWRALGGLALVLLAGVVLGFFVRTTEAVPQIPEELHAAAARMEKGDFSARVPPLAGKLGTVAAALNRAAELAGPAQAARGAPPPAGTDEWYRAPPPAEEPAPAPAPAAVAAPVPAAPFAASQAMPAAVAGFAAAPEAAGFAAAPAAAPVRAAPQPPLAVETDEETHWQQVFQDFLRTRASCGEQSEGLTYEKFRGKLDANKAQLVAKYGCRAVRFQVYVKDGKAALKATPVK
jgi:hypothetical protein